MKKQSGSGLIFAVVLLFVILGMVVTLASVTMLETKMNQKTKSSVGAFYNSESGVEWALNQIATTPNPEITGISNRFTMSGNKAACPDGIGGQDVCSLYFLGADGKVLDPSLATSTVDKITSVRSIGTQGAETQRAIEAAVASGGGGCFVSYNPSGNSCSGDACCHDSAGNQISGFTLKASLGSMEACSRNSMNVNESGMILTPPSVPCPFAWSSAIADAYLCCQ